MCGLNTQHLVVGKDDHGSHAGKNTYDVVIMDKRVVKASHLLLRRWVSMPCRQTHKRDYD